MASLTQWTWVWASSKREWRTGKPGVLQSMGSQSLTWPSNWTRTMLNERHALGGEAHFSECLLQSNWTWIGIPGRASLVWSAPYRMWRTSWMRRGEGTVCMRHLSGCSGWNWESGQDKGGISGSGWVFPDGGASFLIFPFRGSPLTVSRGSWGLLGFHPHLGLSWSWNDFPLSCWWIIVFPLDRGNSSQPSRRKRELFPNPRLTLPCILLERTSEFSPSSCCCLYNASF